MHPNLFVGVVFFAACTRGEKPIEENIAPEITNMCGRLPEILIFLQFSAGVVMFYKTCAKFWNVTQINDSIVCP